MKSNRPVPLWWRPRARRALGVMAGIPAAVALGLSAWFFFGRLKPEQLQPPAAMLRETLRVAGTTGIGGGRGIKRIDNESEEDKKARIRSIMADHAGAYLKLTGTKADQRGFASLMRLEKKMDGSSYNSFDSGLFDYRWEREPLTEKQSDWIEERQEIVEELLEYAESGGAPSISREIVASMTDEELEIMPCLPTQRIDNGTSFLALDTLYRLENGDPEGAARSLRAIHENAYSLRNEGLVGFICKTKYANKFLR